jgi:hypothetical protein
MDTINYINTELAITDTSNTFTTKLNKALTLTDNNKSIEVTNSQLNIDGHIGFENQLLSLDASSNIVWKTVLFNYTPGPTGPSGIHGIGPVGPTGPTGLIPISDYTNINFKLANIIMYNGLIIPLFVFVVNANSGVSITLNPTIFQTNNGNALWTYYEFLLIDKFNMLNVLSTINQTTFDTPTISSTLSFTTTYTNTISTTQTIYFCMKAYLNNDTNYLIQPNNSSAIITNRNTNTLSSSFDSLNLPIFKMRYAPYTNAIGNVYSSDSVTTWSIMNPTNYGYVPYIQGQPKYGITITNVRVLDREIFIDSDSESNLYFTSTISAVSVINNADNTTGLTSSYYGGNDSIVFKMNPLGAIQWVATASSCGSLGSEQSYGLSIDPNNNIFVYGVSNTTSSTQTLLKAYSSNGESYGTNSVLLSSSTNYSAYVTKYNASGTVQGFIVINSNTNSANYIYDIDSNTNYVYLACSCGFFNSSTYSRIRSTISSTTYNIPYTNVESGGYILLLNNTIFDVTPLAYTRITSSGTEACIGVRTDLIGNVYGLFYVSPLTLNTIKLYNSDGITPYPITGGNSGSGNIVISNYTFTTSPSNSLQIQWATVIWSTTAFSSPQHKTKFALDSYGNTYIMILSPTASLSIKDQTSTTKVISTYIGGYIVIKINSLGNYVGSFQMSGVKTVHKIICVGYNLFIDYSTSDKSVVYYSNGTTKTNYTLYSNGTITENYLGNVMMQMNINLSTPPVLVGFTN